MRRWALLLSALATPLSSPLACGGDHCLRNSDCHADQVCSAGQCVLEKPPSTGSGGEGGDDSAPVTAGTTATSGSGGTPQAGTAGKPSDGGETTTPSGGQPSTEVGGAGGDNATPSAGASGLGGAPDLSAGGAPST